MNKIKRIESLLYKHYHGNDPQDELDDERIEELEAELSQLEALQEDVDDAKRKGYL